MLARHKAFIATNGLDSICGRIYISKQVRQSVCMPAALVFWQGLFAVCRCRVCRGCAGSAVAVTVNMHHGPTSRRLGRLLLKLACEPSQSSKGSVKDSVDRVRQPVQPTGSLLQQQQAVVYLHVSYVYLCSAPCAICFTCNRVWHRVLLCAVVSHSGYQLSGRWHQGAHSQVCGLGCSTA